jgi:hypothetical protein
VEVPAGPKGTAGQIKRRSRSHEEEEEDEIKEETKRNQSGERGGKSKD